MLILHEGPRIAPAAQGQIRDLVEKYMEILNIDGPRPTVHIRDNLGAGWLGRALWNTGAPDKTEIEIQRSALAVPLTLERVLAHEMVHHAEFATLSDTDIAKIRIGLKPPSHGDFFRQGAAAINSVMGDGFVTTTSDRTYAEAVNAREFYVLVMPGVSGNKFGYQWIARLGAVGPDTKRWIENSLDRGARLVVTTDTRWTRGPKIKRFGGWGVPREPADAAALADLYDQGAHGFVVDKYVSRRSTTQ